MAALSSISWDGFGESYEESKNKNSHGVLLGLEKHVSLALVVKPLLLRHLPPSCTKNNPHFSRLQPPPQ
jgi:hypothetical protein